LSSFKRHLLIRASAGTGKTFQLSNRYLRLLIDGVPPDQILATTFTRKAAGEILDRVVLRIANAARNDREATKLSGEIGLPGLTVDQCQALLEKLVRNLHAINIGTLDSHFANIARAYCLELQLPPDWTISDESSNQRLQHDAIKSALANEEIDDLIHLLAKGEANQSVWRLVSDAMINLYSLYLESTSASWNRFPQLPTLEQAAIDSLIETMESLQLENRQKSSLAKGIENIRDERWDDFISSGLFPKYLDGTNKYYNKEFPDQLIDCFKQLHSHIKAVLIGHLAQQTASSYQLLTHYHDAYFSLKSDSGSLRFDDVTDRLCRFVRQFQSQSQSHSEQIQFRLDQHISHLLLDEFQDTAPSQWLILTPVVNRLNGKDESSSFFCVGDAKQAIYGWRGGESRLFDAVEATFPAIENEPLYKSYRSSKVIMDFVNAVFQNIPRSGVWGEYHNPINAWCDKFPGHSTTRDLTGFAEVEFSSEPGTQFEEAAQKAAFLYENAPEISIGILVRKNESIARVINALRNLGIPASEEGGNPLTDSPAVRVIASTLKFADFPDDTAAFFHMATSPLAEILGIPPQDHQQLVHNRTLRGQIAAAIRHSLLSDGYSLVIKRWAKLLAQNTTLREVTRLQQLTEFSLQFHSTGTLRPSEFVDALDFHRREEPSSARVRVMTIHKSKGLEFDSVILPDLDQQLVGQAPQVIVDRETVTEPIDLVTRYPNAQLRSMLPQEFEKAFQRYQQNEIHEALCNLYVAITRAVHSVHLIINPKTQPNHKQTASLVLSALDPTPTPQSPFSIGDPNWFHSVAHDPSNRPGYHQDNEFPHREIRFALNKQNHRNLMTDSPSNMEGDDYIQLGSLFRTTENQVALDRGTLIHAAFEQLGWLDKTPLDRDQIANALQQAIVGHDNEHFVDAFFAMIAKPNAIELLTEKKAIERFKQVVPELDNESFQLELRNERPIAVVLDGTLVQGFIDRLVIAKTNDRPIAAEIIDYKSDHISGMDERQVQQRIEHYRPQLTAYRKAIASSTGIPIKRIVARLLFVDQDRLESI
jgi:ATP-dependent helicase/nuclease subunit A